MDERLSQFYVCAAQLCTDARLAALTVSLTLAGGEQVQGIPAAPPETSDPTEELDQTGYADSVSVGGIEVPLSDLVSVAVHRPGAD